VNVDFNIGLLSQNLAATVVLAPVALLHEHLRFDATPAFVGSMLWMILVNSGAGSFCCSCCCATGRQPGYPRCSTW